MEMLLEQFKILFDRPEKIKKLRELILQLAVRGKLVEQDENDEPASVLLERIREEKERLVKEGKIKKEKPLPEIREDEKSYELPKGWEWVRMREVAENIHYGYTASAMANDTGVKFLRITDIQNNKVNWDTVPYCEIDERKLNSCSLRKNDILIARTGGTIGKSFIVKNVECEAVFASYLIRVIPLVTISADYLKLFLETPLYWKQLIEKSQGTGQPNVNAVSLSELMMPLPPLNEQKHLVRKVDSLMAFCDKLEKELERKVKYCSLSSKSIFNSISDCSSAEELEVTLSFIIENFNDLTLGDGAVKELKNAILQLAVQGKLVPQDLTDEPASVLLEKIKEEKEKLISEGKIKREKALPEIREDEKPYELPKSWKWVRMNNVVDVRDGTHDSPRYIETGGYPLVTGKDFYSGKLDFTKTKYISKEDYEKIIMRSKVDVGDILYSMIGGNIGSMVLIEDELNIAIKNVALFKRYIEESFEPKYLMFYLKANLDSMQSLSKGGAQPFVSLSILRNSLFALPPFKEQKCIVQMVDSLMSLCDELEKRIEKSQKYSEKLLEAVLKEAFKA